MKKIMKKNKVIKKKVVSQRAPVVTEEETLAKEFTIVIPTFNSSRAISTVLDYLSLQGFNTLNILIGDNGSVDGTYEMLQTQEKNGLMKNRFGSFVTKNFGHIDGGKEKNIPYMRRMLAQFVETPYIFWLDSDVLLPAHALKELFIQFKKNEDHLGALAIRYNPKADHVQLGATFMRTEIAKNINWKWEGFTCDCRCALIWLGEKKGLGMDYHDTLQARHYPKYI